MLSSSFHDLIFGYFMQSPTSFDQISAISLAIALPLFREG